MFIYEGEFGTDGQPNGYGRYTDEGVTYTGGWVDGLPHGTGYYVLNSKTANNI